MKITNQTARRYVLGRQGLWPGRRSQGKEGVAQAIRQSEVIQVDTINTIGRSHDLALLSRVEDYRPEWLNELLHQDRLFFEYGGILMIYPMSELPYWQTVMQAESDKYVTPASDRHELFEFVLGELRSRGPLGNRDFEARVRIAGGWGASKKDTAAALYRLWRGGRVMTHGRKGLDRLFDLFENVTGRAFGENSVSEEEAVRFFALKAIRDLGLGTAVEFRRRVANMLHRTLKGKEALDLLEGLVKEGKLSRVAVGERKEVCYMPADDLMTLSLLDTGSIPEAWSPQGATTREEAALLAPLDNTIWDRARCKWLFDFEYIWEVYKPESLRQWGYYTLPVLWDDRLVARVHPHMDRKAKTLLVKGLWLEAGIEADDEAFISALAGGLRRLAHFNKAKSINVDEVKDRKLRSRLKAATKRL
jgi:uncharacterized protein YcaQ